MQQQTCIQLFRAYAEMEMVIAREDLAAMRILFYQLLPSYFLSCFSGEPICLSPFLSLFIFSYLPSSPPPLPSSPPPLLFLSCYLLSTFFNIFLNSFIFVRYSSELDGREVHADHEGEGQSQVGGNRSHTNDKSKKCMFRERKGRRGRRGGEGERRTGREIVGAGRGGRDSRERRLVRIRRDVDSNSFSSSTSSRGSQRYRTKQALLRSPRPSPSPPTPT